MLPLLMESESVTRDDDTPGPSLVRSPVAGVVILFEKGPAFRPVPLQRGLIIIGRDNKEGLALQDERASRKHAVVSFDGAAWTIRDLDSHNGTFVDGQRVKGAITLAAPRVLRIGQT